MSLSIRFAVVEDAAKILRFIRELAAFEQQPDAVEATTETLRAALADPAPPFECLIAEFDRQPAGFALFFQSYSTWKGRRGIYVEDLYVSEPMRGRGIGRALLSRVASLACQRGCGRVEWAVLDWNQPAIDFYRSVGAEPLDEWTVYRLTGAALAHFGAG